MMPHVSVDGLQRYPVKGLSAESLPSALLEAGRHFPGDRLFAIENGPSGFDPAAAEHLPKMRFLMLMRNERLARLKTRYDDATGVLTIMQGGVMAAGGRLDTTEGRASIEQFLERWCSGEMRGPARLLTGPPGYRFMDSRNGFVSIVNLGSVAEIAKAAGRETIDPLRFRANIHLTGLGAFEEFKLVGHRLRIGGAVFEVIKPIDRCAAVDVDPGTGMRDLAIVPLLERLFGHHDCGVYARVIEAGTVRPGDSATTLE
ncbi:MAG: MOSC domain-containing protein [Beijerinckiaceae bacterium]